MSSTRLNGNPPEEAPLVQPNPDGKLTYLRSAKTRVVESEVSSNLALQILIYYNWYYSLMMLIIIICTNGYKEVMMKTRLSFLNFLFILAWGFCEWLRLKYGFEGNIKENFPELVAFLIITVVFCVPLLVLQFAVVVVRFPIDEVVAILQLVFMGVEVILVFFAIQRLVKNQTAIFFLRNSKPDLYYRVIPI